MYSHIIHQILRVLLVLYKVLTHQTDYAKELDQVLISSLRWIQHINEEVGLLVQYRSRALRVYFIL